MKVLLLSLTVLYTIACNVQAQCFPGFPPRSTGPTFPRPPGPIFPRFRRETPQESQEPKKPQGSVTVEARQPLGGPNNHPSLDINYKHHIIDDDRTKLDAFAGTNLYEGRFTPHAGIGLEHTFKNDIFVNGQAQVQPGPFGRLSPSFGAGVGWRFRRETPQESQEPKEPQGSVTVEARQPLGGPNNHPSLDINYKHHIIDDDRTKLDAFAGTNLYEGRFTPHAGIGLEHTFKNDIFVNGQAQVQPGPFGRLSPSFGAGVGWRFRRETPQESQEPKEPQGSVTVEARQPLGGPNNHPSLDINYKHHIIDDDRTKLDAFAGTNLYEGRFTPHAGIGLEHTFKNDIFVNGQAQVQPGPFGRLSPSFGAGVGWRFRRETPQESQEPKEPQGSVTVEARQPLGGPNNHPSLDINYKHHIIDDDRTKLDAFAGTNLYEGRFTPHAGIGLEHTFKNDIFVNGQAQVQPGPLGGLSPSFGAGVGWRFRREALPNMEVVEEAY